MRTTPCGSPVSYTHLDVYKRQGYDYVGLNHLGWLRTLVVDGVDQLPALLSSPDRLERIEEARLIGLDWVRQLGALPNEYLFYYYSNREAVERIRSAPSTRGEFLADQQERFYDAAADSPERAFQLWRASRNERERSYMAEACLLYTSRCV